jgi:DNA-binding CsgD family transcriptional regulator
MAEFGETLSERELAVLNRLADGATNREIAQTLNISHNTVKVHVRNIFTKLGVSSRTKATTVALQKGLLSVPGPEADTLAGVQEPAASQLSPTVPDAIAAEDVALPRTSGPGRWRLFGISVLLLLVLLLGAIAGVWFVNRGAENGLSASESMEEEPIGDSRWLISAPMPLERASMAIAAVGLDLYQIGGEAKAGAVNRVDIYETDEGRWHQGASKPTTVAGATGAVLFGEIFVPGGLLTDGRPTSVVEAFSPSNNGWRSIVPLPRPIAGGLALSNDKALYLFGGWDGENFLSDSYVYETNADGGSWRSLPPMKDARAFAAGGVLGGHFYVLGGLDGQTELATCEFFEPEEAIWKDCPDMLLPRAKAGATVLANSLLYVIGGGVTGEASFGEVYDIHTETWGEVEIPILAGMPSWYDLGVASVETRIYILGGRQGDEISSENFVYEPLEHRTFLPTLGSDR